MPSIQEFFSLSPMKQFGSCTILAGIVSLACIPNLEDSDEGDDSWIDAHDLPPPVPERGTSGADDNGDEGQTPDGETEQGNEPAETGEPAGTTGGEDPGSTGDDPTGGEPATSQILHSFESGVDGFVSLEETGTVVQSDAFSTHGGFGLEVTSIDGEWFGQNYPSALDFSEFASISWEMHTDTAGSNQQLAIQTGAGWDWCSPADWAWYDGGLTQTVEVEFASLSCASGNPPVLNEVHALWIFMGNSGGTVYLDNIRLNRAEEGEETEGGTEHGGETGTTGGEDPGTTGEDPGTTGEDPGTTGGEDPEPVNTLFSFETDADGFVSMEDTGTTVHSGAFSTDGDFGLELTSVDGEWFGRTTNYPSALDFSEYTTIAWDLYTDSAGTNQQLVLQTGSGWDWCEAGDWAWYNGGLAQTVEIDFASLVCVSGNPADMTQVQAIWIFMGNSGGTVYIDNVRLE